MQNLCNRKLEFKVFVLLLATIYKYDSVNFKEPDITREANKQKFNTMLTELLLHLDIMLKYGLAADLLP